MAIFTSPWSYCMNVSQPAGYFSDGSEVISNSGTDKGCCLKMQVISHTVQPSHDVIMPTYIP